MKLLRSIVFTVLIPGFVAYWGVPFLLLQNQSAPDFELGLARWLAWPLGAVGTVFLLSSIWEFYWRGEGSPAVWFVPDFVSQLVGREPIRLVESRLYRRSRNPMYLGVGMIVLAEAWWFQSWAMLGYFALLVAAFNIVVIFLEEPHLRRKYGAGYEEFCRKVPRRF